MKEPVIYHLLSPHERRKQKRLATKKRKLPLAASLDFFLGGAGERGGREKNNKKKLLSLHLSLMLLRRPSF